MFACIKRFFPAQKKWRRGDSNPKHANTDFVHNDNNSATDCNEKLLEGSLEKQSHNNSEHFKTLSKHQLGANMVHVNDSDPDLTHIMCAWPTLPEHIKTAIISLVKTHSKEEA